MVAGVVGVREVVATVEVEAARIANITKVERTGPAVAAPAVLVEVVSVAVARSGEIDNVTVLYADHLIAIDGFIVRVGTAYPYPCAVIGIA